MIKRMLPVASIGLFLILAACSGGSSSNSADNSAANTAMTSTNAADNSATNASSDNGGGAMSGAAGMATVPPDLNCGAVKPVWVNLNTKAYHEPGDQYYGMTKHGQYMCPSEAKKEGYHPAGGSMKSHHHSNS